MENTFNSTQKIENVKLNEGDIAGGGGEMEDLIWNFNWSANILGPVVDWPKSLKIAVNIMLKSPAPMIILWGEEGISLYNDAYSTFAGLKHPGMLGARCEDVWPEAADFIRNVKKTCLSGASLSYKNLLFKVYRNEAPEDIWMNLDCSPIVDDNNNPAGTLIVNVEVTQQVQALERQKQIEDRFEVAMAAAGMVGTWDWHIEQDIVYADPRFTSLFSVDPKKGELGAPMAEYLKGIYPEDVLRVDNAMEEAIKKNEKYSEKYRLLQKDGTIRWIIAKGQCFYENGSKPVRFSGIAVDITDRKEIEEVLQESQERFSNIFNQSSVGIAQTDLNGKFTLVNNRYCEILGRSKEELYNLSLYDITHKDDLNKNIPLMERAIKKGVPFKMEKRYIRPDGSVVWVNINVSTVKDKDAKPLYLIGVCHNITERKLAEKALAFQNKITKKVTDNATVAMFMLDSKGRTTFANPAAEKMTGYKQSEMKGIVLHDLIHHLHPDGSPFSMESCKIGKTIFTLGHLKNHEDIFIRKNGSFFPILCSATAIKEENDIIGIILEVQDITERKHAEQALKESEQRFRILADAAPSFVWALNPDASIKYVNKYSLEFLGVPLESLTNKKWQSFIHPDDLEKTKVTAKEAILKENIYTVEHRLLRHDGTYRWILTQGGPSYYPNGALYGYVGSSVDITDQKKSEKALELKNSQLLRINNDLDNFIYTASHDLKSPISNIEGLVNALNLSMDDKSRNNEEINKIISMIHHSIHRFKNTIKDLTEVAKVQNNIEEDLSEISFKDMIEEVKLNIKTDIDESNATIYDDFSQAPFIYFSKKNLRSILYNLVSNAIKYRSPKRPVEIRISTSSPDDKYILLTVQDNGLGIKKEDKYKVFTMFKRLHQHVEGTGIGLAIVKKIIDNNGGKIEIDSEAGKGTIFSVYFKVNV